MMTYGNNPQQNYARQREQEILSASPVKIIRLLMEGVITLNKKACLELQEGKEVHSVESVERASRIIIHLYDSLNFDEGGDIAKNLASLYGFSLEQYNAYMKGEHNAERIQNVTNIITTLLEGWRELEKGHQNV